MAENDVILVTGGSGLVGKAVQRIVNDDDNYRKLGQRWVFLSSKDADLTKSDECNAIFEKHRPTFVLHLAAKVGGVFANMQNNLQFFRDNMAISDNIFSCAHKYGVKKLIACTSTCIFPDKTTYPIDETMIHLGPPHHSNMGYAYAKRMTDVLCKLYNEEYGCRFTTVVPCNVFGPYDNFNLTDSHVISGLIHKCYVARRDGTPLIVYGTGKPLRQFIYSVDLAKLILWALYNYDEPEPIILCPDEHDEVTIKQVVDELVTAFDFRGPIEYDTSKSDGQYKKTATNEKLRRYLPDFKFTPLPAAIKETTDWFIANYDTARK